MASLHHSCDHQDDIFRPEKECPELPDPDNGQVHLTGRNFQVSGIETFLSSMIILTLQDRAVYTCDGGYRLVGVEKVRLYLIIIIILIIKVTSLPRLCVRQVASGQEPCPSVSEPKVR